MTSEYRKYILKSNEEQAHEIHTLRFEPLEGEVPEYVAGQFFMIKNTNLPPESKPKIKPYSALHVWRKNELTFGIKVHKNFSVAMCKLKPEDQLEICGPFGFFTLPKEIEYPIVFLAGGIGITPLITMIEKLVEKKHCGKYYLFYSNRGKKDIAYREELEKLAAQNKNFRLIYVMTGDQDFDFECLRGRLTAKTIKQEVDEFESAHVYMCATKGFIESMQEGLLREGFDKERIHVERW